MGETKTGQTYPFETGMFRGNTAETSGVTGQLKFGWLSNNLDIDAII